MLKEAIRSKALYSDKELRAFKEQIEENLEEFFQMQNAYLSAIREVSTKLEILDEEFQVYHRRNPIHHIESRLKSPQSMGAKLKKQGFPISLRSAREHLSDLAGIRVICNYIDDIYTIARLLTSQDDIQLVKERDYIRHPKENGYRSLHLVLKVPVFFSDHKELVPVEIQIRTIAMDFWASLEHQLRYKSMEIIPSTIMQQLQECAETITATDQKMQEIYYQLEQLGINESR